ncbi:hypothetical protein V8G54_021705, partial [Vigna mungo]
MEHCEPSRFQRPVDLRREIRRLRRLQERILAGEHEIEGPIAERNPFTSAKLHKRLHPLPRNSDGVFHADLPQRGDVASGRRFHAQGLRLQRKVTAGNQVLKSRRVEPNAFDPVLAGVKLGLQRSAAGDRLDGERTGAGDDEAERLRQREKTEVADVARLASNSDD